MAVEQSNVEVLVAVYGTEDGAEDTLKQVEAMENQGIIEIIDGAVMVHEEESGKIEAKQLGLTSVGKSSAGGAIIGGIIGLLFPPAFLGATALGAALGAGAGKLSKIHQTDKEVDEFLNQTAESLEPGTSALIVVMEDKLVPQLIDGLEGYSKLLEKTLNADAAAALGVQQVSIADESSSS